MKKISEGKPISTDHEPHRAETRTLEVNELEQVAAAGSKPGCVGDGRALLGDRHELL